MSTPAPPVGPLLAATAPRAWIGDLRGALVTWLGSIYLVALIPMILDGGSDFSVLAVGITALACSLGTALFAAVTRLPLAVGPGIVPASIVAGFLASGIPFSVVLGIELLAGAAFVLLVWTGAIQAWVRHTPPLLKGAGQVAIGLYLFLAALKAAGWLGSPLKGLPVMEPTGVLFLAGLALVFLLRHLPALASQALLVGMLATTAAAAAWGLSRWPDTLSAAWAPRLFVPDLASAFDLSYLDEVLVLLYVVVVDVIATLDTLAACVPALRGPDGQLRHHQRALRMSAVVFAISPLLGTAPMLVLFENLGGVLSGARRALAGGCMALGFAALAWLAPMAQVVPAFVCAVALAYVGYSITQFAVQGLSRAGPSGLASQLVMLAVVVITVSHNLALTMFTLFVAYPLGARLSGMSVRAGDLAAAALCLGLIVTLLR